MSHQPLSDPSGLWLIRGGSTSTGEPALLAAERPLAEALLARWPAATPSELLVAARGCAGLLPAGALSRARLVVLLDPTESDRVAVLDVVAGQSETRLVVVPALGTISRAEHALALILALTRKLFVAYSELYSFAQQEAASSGGTSSVPTVAPNWVSLAPPSLLDGKTLGIVGLGRTGTALAERARGLGLKLLYNDIEAKPEQEVRLSIRRRTLDRLLSEADIVSLHVPAREDTRRLIDAPELAAMSEQALLINVAHGSLIDEGALIKALRQRLIGGAGLDVFAQEPLPGDSPLLALDNVVLTPHIAALPPAAEHAYFAGAVVATIDRHGR